MKFSFFIVGLLFFLAVVSPVLAQTPASVVPSAGSLSFSPENISAQVNQTFTTQLFIDTAGAQVGGVDAKITFDPTVLSVEKIETKSVFPDYPAASFDNVRGTVIISGIVRSKETLYSGQGNFADITWKAKTSGDATVKFNFLPNQTNDSNIAVLYGNGDILQKVNQLIVKVAPAAANESIPQGSPTIILSAQPVEASAPGNSGKDSALSPVDVLLLITTFSSLGFQFYLYRHIKRIEKYKESIPHIHLPSK